MIQAQNCCTSSKKAVVNLLEAFTHLTNVCWSSVHNKKNESFLAYFIRNLDSCVVCHIRSFKPRCAPANPAARYPVSSKISDLLWFLSCFTSQNKETKFDNFCLKCVVYIKTFWLDVRHPKQTAVRDWLKHWQVSDFAFDLNYFSFSQPNPNPNPTHSPKHESLSPNHQFSQRIWYIEYYSVHVYMAWSQKFRLTPDYSHLETATQHNCHVDNCHLGQLLPQICCGAGNSYISFLRL